jgi:hypothetical protein
MRRRLLWGAALGLAIVFAGVLAGRDGGLTPSGPTSRIAARIVGRVAEAVIADVRSAQAQEVLEFKPVPAESVSKLERSRARRRPSITVTTDPPEPPEPPEPPDPPEAPEVAFGKSGNVMRIGSDVHVESNQVVSGDLLAVGGDVTVDGHVEGDVVAMGGDVKLSATARVDGDVASIGGELIEEPGAFVGGQRVTAVGMKGARGLPGRDRLRLKQEFERVGHVGSSMVWLLIMLAVAWGISKLAPGRTGAALAILKRETLLSLGIGALVWALIIPSVVALALVVAILCITIIGIPLALAALLGYAVFLVVLWVWGYVVGTLAVGDWASARMSARAAATSGAATTTTPASLSRRAVLGVLIVSGAGLAGEILQTLFFAPPLQGFGVFISVVSTVAGALAATFGAGAWLRSEFKSGTLGRWWSGRRAQTAAAASAPAPSVPPAPAPGPLGPPEISPSGPGVTPPSVG